MIDTSPSPLRRRDRGAVVYLTLERPAAGNSLSADLIASKSGHTLASGKAGFYHQRSLPEAQAYDFACSRIGENIAHPDAREGIHAFLDKRTPVWSANAVPASLQD